MKESDKTALQLEVVSFVYLISTRNTTAVENKAAILFPSLENQLDPSLQGLFFFAKGMLCFFRNNYDEAKAQFDKIFDLSFSLHDTDLHGLAHMGTGFSQRSAGRLDDAVTNISLATDIINKNGPFKVFLGYCYHQLGEIHVAINEYENAIKYFTTAFTIIDGESNTMASLRYHNGLGGCYLKMKDYEKSEFHLIKSLEVKDLPPTIISRVENDLGELYLEKKEYDKAEKLLTSSIKVREANKLEDAACTSMTALAEVYLQQGRISEALQLLDRCMALVEKYQTKLKKVRVLNLMARAHSRSENYEEAVGYYEQHQVLNDSVKGEQERNIFKFKNAQIEKQKKVISEKHKQLAGTVEEIKRLKVNRKAAIFSWITIIILVVISELFLDPLIENYAYDNLLSLLVKVMIALLFKPIDGIYEKLLWERALKKRDDKEAYE